MAVKMKKSDLIIAFSIITLAISGLLIGFASCQQMESFYDEEEEATEEVSPPTPTPIPIPRPTLTPSPLQLPVANIPGGEPQSSVVSGDNQFSLQWQPSNDNTLDSPANISALKATYNKWDDYESFVDTLPFYRPTGEQSKQYEVWVELDGNMALNNNASGGELVIRRYWNNEWGKLTTATWTAKRTEREAAFKTAKAQIEKMMADIKESPFWNTSYEDDDGPVFPLQQLHARMGNFIKEPSAVTLYTDRGTWGDDERSGAATILSPAKTGPLYELYFGHIPGKTEYLDQSSTAVYVYPVE
jgi:hypothetical protein